MPDYAPTQDGYRYPSEAPWNGSGLWVEAGSTFYVLGTLGGAGLVFDTSAGVTFSALTLTLTYAGEIFGIGDGELRLYLTSAASPALFSDANAPSTSGKALVATVVSSVADTGPVVFSIDVAAANAVAALSGWTGRLAFVLVFVGAAEGVSRQFASSEVASGPVLSATTVAAEVAVEQTASDWFCGRFTDAAFSRG